MSRKSSSSVGFNPCKDSFFNLSSCSLDTSPSLIGVLVLPQEIKKGGIIVVPKVIFPKKVMNFFRLYFLP